MSARCRRGASVGTPGRGGSRRPGATLRTRGPRICFSRARTARRPALLPAPGRVLDLRTATSRPRCVELEILDVERDELRAPQRTRAATAPRSRRPASVEVSIGSSNRCSGSSSSGAALRSGPGRHGVADPRKPARSVDPGAYERMFYREHQWLPPPMPARSRRPRRPTSAASQPLVVRQLLIGPRSCPTRYSGSDVDLQPSGAKPFN